MKHCTNNNSNNMNVVYKYSLTRLSKFHVFCYYLFTSQDIDSGCYLCPLPLFHRLFCEYMAMQWRRLHTFYAISFDFSLAYFVLLIGINLFYWFFSPQICFFFECSFSFIIFLEVYCGISLILPLSLRFLQVFNFSDTAETASFRWPFAFRYFYSLFVDFSDLFCLTLFLF